MVSNQGCAIETRELACVMVAFDPLEELTVLVFFTLRTLDINFNFCTFLRYL